MKGGQDGSGRGGLAGALPRRAPLDRPEYADGRAVLREEPGQSVSARGLGEELGNSTKTWKIGLIPLDALKSRSCRRQSRSVFSAIPVRRIVKRISRSFSLLVSICSVLVSLNNFRRNLSASNNPSGPQYRARRSERLPILASPCRFAGVKHHRPSLPPRRPSRRLTAGLDEKPSDRLFPAVDHPFVGVFSSFARSTNSRADATVQPDE